MSLKPDAPETPNMPAVKKLDVQAAATDSASANPEARSKLISDLMGTLYFAKDTPIEDKFKKTNALLALAASMEPRDAMEAQMIAQMLGAHNIAMDLLERANRPGLMAEARAAQMKHAEKFMRIYSEQMRTLEKYRARDARRVVVEQVRVESGGQAIVGVVTQAGARE